MPRTACPNTPTPNRASHRSVSTIRQPRSPNGAVWIAQDIRHKALYFGATALLIVIPRTEIVHTMHEAVERPETEGFGYGCFMSGPSKTADIEQALVFGAHGPMSVTVLLA